MVEVERPAREAKKPWSSPQRFIALSSQVPENNRGTPKMRDWV